MMKEGEEYHGILNTKYCHWGRGQTGIGLFEDGSFKISENKPIFHSAEGYISEGSRYYPTHRSLGGFPGIFSFGYVEDQKHSGTIWLYPAMEENLPRLRQALVNMIGHYGITEETVIRSNSGRGVICRLGDLERRE